MAKKTKDEHRMVSINLDAVEYTRTRDSVVTQLTTLQNSLADLTKSYINNTNVILAGSSEADIRASTLDPLAHISLDGGAAAQPVPAGKTRKKRAPYVKDPNAPPKPLTAYFAFMQEARPIITKELGDHLKPKELSEELTRRWNNLQESEREVGRRPWLGILRVIYLAIVAARIGGRVALLTTSQSWKLDYQSKVAVYKQQMAEYKGNLSPDGSDAHEVDELADVRTGVVGTPETGSDTGTESSDTDSDGEISKPAHAHAKALSPTKPSKTLKPPSPAVPERKKRGRPPKVKPAVDAQAVASPSPAPVISAPAKSRSQIPLPTAATATPIPPPDSAKREGKSSSPELKRKKAKEPQVNGDAEISEPKKKRRKSKVAPEAAVTASEPAEAAEAEDAPAAVTTEKEKKRKRKRKSEIEEA
ncbi:hypothetical protein LTR28_010099 [Elasticomyces elasticus]|nr:hypothetical protein LTR28_010099 [Elasticomyces elasticus]